MARVALFGAGGFVGSAVRRALAGSDHDIDLIHAPRLQCQPAQVMNVGALDTSRSQVTDLADRLSGREVVVNAAGLATPTSGQSSALYGANSYWPIVLAAACERAGVRQLVHVSSAAVQGRQGTLDEEAVYAPVGPYGESKALAERALGIRSMASGMAVTLYRPTSVHGIERPLTRSFANFCQRWPLYVAGSGTQPVPVCLEGNVGAGIAALVGIPSPPPIALQPSEDMTVRSLYEVFAPGRRIRSVPTRLVRFGLGGLDIAGRAGPRCAAIARRADLLFLGQASAPTWLDHAGFRPPFNYEAWIALAEQLRG